MELKKDKIAAVVVWFNPGAKEVDAIRLYNEDVARVFVVDNTPADNASLLAGLGNVEYVPLMENRGIAAALNEGCRRAAKLGSEWILTMDQDSRWDIHSIPEYINEVQQYENFDETGIFTPYHDCDGHPERHHLNGRFEPKNVVMCSGNLLRTDAWSLAGGFREDFFIDSVDDEMCCHLRQLDYRIIRANHIYLNHMLGEGVQYVPIIHHPYIAHKAWRYYYISRNMHRMIRLYPDMTKYYKKAMRKYLKRLMLYDWDDKIAKLRNLRKGWYEEN